MGERPNGTANPSGEDPQRVTKFSVGSVQDMQDPLTCDQQICDMISEGGAWPDIQQMIADSNALTMARIKLEPEHEPDWFKHTKDYGD